MDTKISLQSRRNILLSATAGIGLSAAWARSGFAAQVQEISDDDIAALAGIGMVMDRAETAFIDFVLSQELLDPEIEKYIHELLPKLIADLAKYGVLLLVLHDQVDLAQMMLKLDLNINLIPDGKELPAPLQGIRVKPQKPCSEVFETILLDTLGFDDDARKGFRSFMKAMRLEPLMREIAEAAERQDWPRVALLLRKFLIKAFGREALRILENSISREALKKTLGILASRFVPFIGWALLGIDLMMALHKNWSSLDACRL